MTDDVQYNYTEGKLKETKTEDENGEFKRTDVIIYKEENKPTPYVNLRNITSLKFCDDAIGKCWDKQSNELNTARMDRVINKHKHECYSSDTDVLTINGWKSIKDVTLDDKICTLNQESLHVEYHAPDKLFKYPYDGKLINFKSRYIDLLVTPNHKVYVSDGRKKSNRDLATRNFELINASDALNITHIHTKRSNGVKGDAGISYGVELMKLIGFFIGDGYISGLAICFNIIKERKITYLKNILDTLGYTYNFMQNKRICIHIPNNVVKLFRNCYLNKEKRIPPELLYGCSVEELTGILDGLINADGDYNLYCRQLYEIATTSQQLKEDISILAVHIGRDMTVAYTRIPKHDTVWPDGKITYKENLKPCHYLRVSRRSLYTRFNNNKYEPKPVEVDYVGDVYCLEVTNHVLMTRRNDKLVWSGNSTVEHIVAQFEISNVSRLLLQELARHRMASITVKSTRYTLKELKDEEPFDCSTMINFMESMIRAKKYLVYPQDLITYIPDEKDQLVNKAQIMALEQLRSLVAAGVSSDKVKYALPESYKTELSWTINFRSLRNFLKLRTDKAAHFEIRALANAIYNAIPEEYRFLLKDMLYDEPVDTEA